MAKYHYYKIFRRDEAIRPHLPETAICTPSALEHYLHKYRTVFIKPNVGGKGEGVTKAWVEYNRYVYVMEKGERVYCSSPQELYRRIGLAHRKTHVVQRAIPLASYRGRPYDIRLMMIRSPKRRWQYAGMLAKVAGRGSIITNVNRGGGYVVPIGSALAHSHGASSGSLQRQMMALARRCSRMFDSIRYEWQIGYDMAVDRSGKVWLIEANPGNPSHALFAKLPDKTLYRTIKRAVSAYRKSN